MLVSPAEPPQLRKLGKTSSLPETYGADFLIHSPLGLVGVQRKELSDLVASLHDDRVSREIIQMRELDWAIWILEGVPTWTSDGLAMWTRTKYTKAQHLGVLFSLSSQGFSILSSTGTQDTIGLLSAFNDWVMKSEHRGINQRSSPRGMWGKPDAREWQINFLQGLPGMGYTRAAAVVDFYGCLPFKLDGVLEDVPGVGKRTADRIRGLFE
jgi:ERCC4-type nuclease